MKNIEQLQTLLNEGLSIAKKCTKTQSKENEVRYFEWLDKWKTDGEPILLELDDTQRANITVAYKMVERFYTTAHPYPQESAETKSIQDPELGEIDYDPADNTWTAVVDIRDFWVDIHFEATKEEIPDQAINAVKLMLDMQESIESAIAKTMLDNYNDNWRDEGGALLSKAEFIDLLEPESIIVSPDGKINYCWNDGPSELFGAHWIKVRINPDGSICEVGLAG